MPAKRDDDRLVTVCDKCRQASCWQGVFMCQESRDAGTVDVPVRTLRIEKRENPEWWKPTDPREPANARPQRTVGRSDGGCA